MRNLLVLIIIAAGVYFGWKTWQEQPEWLTRVLPKSTPTETAETETDSVPPPAATPAPAVPTPRPTPALPKFVSRIAIPAESTGAEPGKVPPGSFLVIDRASVETKDGVVAIVPGDQVRLVERHNNGTMTVTNGREEFVVKDTQVTQEIAVAQEAERKDFERRYGRVQ